VSGYDDDRVTAAALAARAGDRQAAERFVALTYPQVQRLLAHLCDPGEVDDLTQETYLRAMRGLPRFAARCPARAWLLSIARRVAADRVRAAMRSPRTTAWEGNENAAEAALQPPTSRTEDGAVLRDLLDRLTPERREAFVLTQVLGLGYEEAAQVCDCPVGTIRSRVARARVDLVAAYRDAEPGPGHRSDTA
jgi:RNA polymerase sigma-70 factor, ECF subfamily